MKAALVSATSLAALLAFEVGLDVAIDAHPAKAASFIVEQPTLNFGYVLLNTTATLTSLLETVSNTNGFGNNITFPTVTLSAFSGTSLATLVGATASATHPYTLSIPSGATLGTNYSLQATISSGSNRTAITLSASAVAPEQKTGAGTTSFGAVRIGTTATIAALTVSNIGNGDLYNSTLSQAQLQVSLGTPSNSVFTAGNNLTLNDSHYSVTGGTATVSAPANYLYAPTTHTVGQTASATLNFLNGGGLTNGTTASVVTLTGTGIGPVFKGIYNGTSYVNSTAIGTSVNNAGNISLGTQKHGATTTFTITLANATTDTQSGSLANLTLNGFSLGTCVVTGCVYDGFSVLSFPTGQIADGGPAVTVTLDFSGGLQTYYNADLSFNTDQGAATGLGGTGAVFSYLLSANIPEPATIVTFGMGLAGLGWVRRRRAARRSAIGTTSATA
jgi:hypothetical protein